MTMVSLAVKCSNGIFLAIECAKLSRIRLIESFPIHAWAQNLEVYTCIP